MKPRIFISAVSSELRTIRGLVSNVLERLGYEPVRQDIFGTKSGDLRQALRETIDDCDGLVQIVGHGYGAEPPLELIDPTFGRVSYTQFEFLYALQKQKKTWLIYAGEACTRDTPLDQLDLPRDTAHHPAPATYQAERRVLQDAWRQRWKGAGETPESHLRYPAASDMELELKIERLREEFSELRRGFRRWQKWMLGIGAAVLVLLGVMFARQEWLKRDTVEIKHDTTVLKTKTDEIKDATTDLKTTTESGLKAIAEQLAALKPDDVKSQLRRTIEETYQQQLQEAEKLAENQEDAKKSAAETRDRRLEDVDEFLKPGFTVRPAAQVHALKIGAAHVRPDQYRNCSPPRHDRRLRRRSSVVQQNESYKSWADEPLRPRSIVGMDVRKRIGLNLKRLRADRKITQEDFATDSGFDRGYLSGVERGVRNPSALVLERLAKALKVDVMALFDLQAATDFARKQER